MKNSETQTERWPIELTDIVSMNFCHIPPCPGGFLMGSRSAEYADEEPHHRVVIGEDFWLGATPVTQAQFDLWPGSAERGADHDPSSEPHHPANRLNWHDSMGYCDWLTAEYGAKFPSGFVVACLPFEAHWEYACRGDASGTRATDYHTGDGEAALDAAGWYDNNSHSRTHAVASRDKLSNAFGHYDMHGNVWEWCLDRWDADAYRRRWDGITERETFLLNEKFGDQNSDRDKVLRVQRGGSCIRSAAWCRSACRFRLGAGCRFGSFGFRVCLVRSPPVSAEPERTASERLEGAEVAGSGGAADEILNTDFGIGRHNPRESHNS